MVGPQLDVVCPDRMSQLNRTLCPLRRRHIFGALKSTDVYKTAVARAKANMEVRAALGDDVHPGIFLSGNTNVSGGSGQADLSIPISGSKGKGTIYVVATKSAGEWNYSQLVVKTESGETIDLAAPEKKDEL